MNGYLSNTDDGAFLDFPKKSPERNLTKECPVCFGYGGWNLKPNAYLIPHLMENNAENRHKFSHFKCCCNHCFGWGYVEEDNKCDGHKWSRQTIGNCLHEDTCEKCGLKILVDSGD